MICGNFTIVKIQTKRNKQDRGRMPSAVVALYSMVRSYGSPLRWKVEGDSLKWFLYALENACMEEYCNLSLTSVTLSPACSSCKATSIFLLIKYLFKEMPICLWKYFERLLML